jgi:CRP-like cAMP-binding protein
MTDLEVLARLPLTRSLRPAAQRAIAAESVIRAFKPGAVLWTAGTRINCLAVVIEGSVRVVRERRGRRHVIHTEGPGGTLGEVPLFTGGAAPATPIAAERTRCLMLTRGAIERAMALDPEFAWILLGRMAERVRLLVDRLDRLAVESARTRLVGHLAHARANGATITLGMTQSALAAELGTVREVIVRTLHELRAAGLIEAAGKGRIHIINVPAMRALAAAGSVHADQVSAR